LPAGTTPVAVGLRGQLHWSFARVNPWLLVVLAEAVDGRWYEATARDMTDTERRAFRRKGR
jgi:hypothetical protein